MSVELSRELGLGIGSCDPIRLVTADGASLVGRLIPAVPLQLGSRSYSWGIYAGPMADQLILGLDFLSTYGCIIDLDSNFLVVGGEVIVAVLRRNKDCGNAVFLCTSRVELLFPLTMRESKLNGYDYIINPLGVHPGWLPRALVRVAQGKAYVDIVNTSRESVLLYPGQLLASAELVGSSPRPTPDRTELRGPPQPVVRIISGSAVVPNISDDRDRECLNKQVKSNMALVEGIPPGRLNVDGTTTTGVPEHLVALSERARKELNEEQVSIMLNLLREFQDVFSRGDSDLERYNRTLLQAIRCLLPERQSSWDAHLPLVGMALRAGVNRTTGFSPNLMMLGREVLSPLELVTGVSAENLHEQEPAQYVRELLQRMKSVHDEARRHVGLVQRTQKRTYDLHLHERSYEKGDLVYQRNEAGQVGQSRKLQPIFVGPVLVTQVLSPVLFRVENRKRSYVLHHDRLIPCKDRVIPLWIRRKRHDLLGDDTTLDEDDEEVEADILPEWWRRQDAEAGQGATARPPAPPGGPVGIKLPGKSATITPPDAPPSFVEGEVGSVSGKGPQSPIRPPTPLGGLPSLRLVSRKSVPGLAGSLNALSTLTQIFCCIKCSLSYNV